MGAVLPVAEVAVASTASLAVATGVSAEPLLTALISLGISLVTVVGGELVKFLYNLIHKKNKELEDKDSKAVEDKNKEE